MRHCSSRRLALLVPVLLMLVMLAGCGQKGPLYLPGDEEAVETYDPGGEYNDERAGENDDEDDGSQDSSDDAETTSGDEG